MKDNGTLTQEEEATICEAMGIMGRWLEEHRDDEHKHHGYWGIEEARRQLRANFWAMRDD